MRLKTVARWVIALAVVTGLGACSFSKKDNAEDVAYKKNGILLDIQAGEDLNTFNDQAHTLVLVVYQLADPNVYNQMVEEPEGVAKLLEAGAFDASVLSRRRIVVQPSDTKKLHLDRAAGVRYIGVVAGYFSRQPKDFNRLVPFTYDKKSKFFWHKTDADPAETSISLVLGRSGLKGK